MKPKIEGKTHEVSSPVNKRGRPRTGLAKTPAERKREQRSRERSQMGEALTSPTISMKQVTTTTLCDELAKAINGGYRTIAKDILAELKTRIH